MRSTPDHEHYCTGNSWLWNICCMLLNPVCYWGQWLKQIRGGLADWSYHSSHLQKQVPCTYNGGSNPWTAGNVPCVPCHTIWSGRVKGTVSQSWAGHWSTGGKQLFCASLALYILFYYNYHHNHHHYLSSFSVQLIYLYLNPQGFTFFPPPNSLPHPTGRGEWTNGCVPAWLNHNATL